MDSNEICSFDLEIHRFRFLIFQVKIHGFHWNLRTSSKSTDFNEIHASLRREQGKIEQRKTTCLER